MSGKDDFRADSAMNVMDGINSTHDGMTALPRKRFVKKERAIPISELTTNIANGSRLDLAKGITLIESITESDKRAGQQLLLNLLPKTGNSIRVGITGVPGAGKSTFIESFGLMLAQAGHKVAVLAIDPSSSLTGGSILGDKTRMEELARHPNAFIRPSPTAGTLGGVHKKSRETMLLCEAAGYDIILIETVGVGQSETVVRGMVDFFMLLVLTGAGDELQGMKKGIMELTDLIVVHKADGDNLKLAKKTVREYKQLLHILQPTSPGWISTALPVSSLAKTGLNDVWEKILSFKEKMENNHAWEKRRNSQTKDWFHSMINDRLIDSFFAESGRKESVARLENELLQGNLTVTSAVDLLFEGKRNSDTFTSEVGSIKKIETANELFNHFEDMGIQKSMSKIQIPEIGIFRIFLQDDDSSQHDAVPEEDEIPINDNEKFKLWHKVLMVIEHEISRPSFETWFTSTSALQLDEHHICVICNNSFMMDWLKSHYKSTIISALKEVTGKTFELEFCVNKML